MPGMNLRPGKQCGQTRHQSEVRHRHRTGRIKPGRSDDAPADFAERAPDEKKRSRNPKHGSVICAVSTGSHGAQSPREDLLSGTWSLRCQCDSGTAQDRSSVSWLTVAVPVPECAGPWVWAPGLNAGRVSGPAVTCTAHTVLRRRNQSAESLAGSLPASSCSSSS